MVCWISPEAVVTSRVKGPNHLRKFPKKYSVSQFQNKAGNILIFHHKGLSNVACHEASSSEKESGFSLFYQLFDTLKDKTKLYQNWSQMRTVSSSNFRPISSINDNSRSF